MSAGHLGGFGSSFLLSQAALLCWKPRCAHLKWGEGLDQFETTYGTFDLILGSDLLYTRGACQPLFQTVGKLLHRKPCSLFLLAHRERRTKLKRYIYQHSKECGLRCREIPLDDIPDCLELTRKMDELWYEANGATLQEIFDLSAEQIAEYREAFSVYRDSNGTVTVDRLGKVLESVGEKCSNDELMIDFREFLSMMQKRKEETDASDVISEAFMLFDTNGDGYLGAEELRHVMTCLGEQLTDEDVENMVRLADMDGDGKINFAEFATMMSSDQ
ncbi:hypothetical protein Bbelb_258640 [Branchiostoma belcheri]|nr:hypothetical protein Bbelb_258640 [Branchiostoma belcheri]